MSKLIKVFEDALSQKGPVYGKSVFHDLLKELGINTMTDLYMKQIMFQNYGKHWTKKLGDDEDG